jgi:hypothetical protein
MYVNATGMGALNCPGDPGCPGNTQSVNFSAIGIPDAQLAANGGSSLYAPWSNGELPTGSPSSSSGISGTTVAIAGGALFGFVLLLKALR